MNPASTHEQAFHVVVFAAPEDLHELAQVLHDVLGMHPTDAIIHARLMPGILSDRLSRLQADRLAAAIDQLGLHAESISADEIPELDHGEAVHHVKCLETGLEIIDLRGALEARVPWDEIELICVGIVPQETARHYATNEMATLSAARRTTHLALDVPLPEGPELWIIRRSPLRAFRVDHRRMNYEYLGDRKTDSATVNFRSFLDDLLQNTPHAYVTPSTRAYLGHRAERMYHFDSTGHLLRYAQFHLLVRRRAAAGVAVRPESADAISPSHPSSGTTGEKHRRLVFHCLSCGTVLHQGLDMETPACCGEPMITAVGMPINSPIPGNCSVARLS